MFLAYSGELDPVLHGDAYVQTQALKPEKFPCPNERWKQIRADQAVAEYSSCSIQQARRLPPLEYSELLFAASATLEAQPMAEAYAEAKEKEKTRAEAAAKKQRGLGG